MSRYDRADIYDIAFSWDIEPELSFVRELWDRYGSGPLRCIYEPFCGTGRLVVPLAENGFECVGVDLSERMLDILKHRVAGRDLPLQVERQDVQGYVCAEPVDVVVTLIDSFRHLTSQEAATNGMQSFQQSLRSGGLLIIGLEVGEPPAEMDDLNTWEMERDGVVIEAAVFSLRQQGDEPGTILSRSAIFISYPDGREEELVHDEPMRGYSRTSLIELATESGQFEFLAGFNYGDLDAKEPTEFDEPGGNSVFVFRRV